MYSNTKFYDTSVARHASTASSETREKEERKGKNGMNEKINRKTWHLCIFIFCVNIPPVCSQLHDTTISEAARCVSCKEITAGLK